jgi:hypothetical protein
MARPHSSTLLSNFTDGSTIDNSACQAVDRIGSVDGHLRIREAKSGHISFQPLERWWLVTDSAKSNRCMGTTNLIDMGIIPTCPY